MTSEPDGALRRGWTTGACAAAATRAAYTACLTGGFPDPVTIRLPRGETPSFALAFTGRGDRWASAGVVKDAGDDPDVTHGALVIATVREAAAGSGVSFRAGEGVGTVTLPGLPLAPGEPAINPMPRRMMEQQIAEIAAAHGGPGDVEIEIAIPGGDRLAARTWNPRLGIVGGLSVLGTTGVVIPYSCAAWIHSIRQGVDVARALGHDHVGAATGNASEAALRARTGLAETAVIDMGDFAGGLLNYLRRHPVPRLTIAGGFAKLAKLAQGALDLHSARSEVDLARLADMAGGLGGSAMLAADIRRANMAGRALELAAAAGLPLGDAVAAAARDTARGVLGAAPVAVAILVVDRTGRVVGEAAFDGA